ncbi:MAG: hypothetical protein HON53_05350 [Planctomycetaceae bacterium]|nr:hypothetical protein [Planctomycetaceae bacterium]MBT6156057.1 hypothetical protein [Planctomycetaceae bacterium]MBT6487502.1 hypothetical protein [Planctomycetaceae bacterium]MBT6495871.1 hypothetical protein [Planctomycetaceae bacterium]
MSNAWHASILPSFHDSAVIAAVRAHDTEFRGEAFPGFFRAGIAIVSRETSALVQTVIADIDDDPLPAAVSSIDLLASDDSCFLDGIGYELNTDTSACHATIRFSNPTVPSFQHIERALFTLAEHIARSSLEPTVVEYVKMWRGYLVNSERQQ